MTHTFDLIASASQLTVQRWHIELMQRQASEAARLRAAIDRAAQHHQQRQANQRAALARLATTHNILVRRPNRVR